MLVANRTKVQVICFDPISKTLIVQDEIIFPAQCSKIDMLDTNWQVASNLKNDGVQNRSPTEDYIITVISENKNQLFALSGQRY